MKKFNWFIKDNKDSEVDDTTNQEQSFFKRMKNDSKYKAKVELTGYAIFIIVLIIFLNIFNTGGNYDYSYGNNTNNKVSTDNTDKNNDVEEGTSLFDDINNNYSYDVLVDLAIKDDTGNTNSYNVNYNGKCYKDNLIINKSYNGETHEYYKFGSEYYIKADDNYSIVKNSDIYDLLDGKYIELSGIKEYINKASLDHFTNYSSGRKEYVYNLKIDSVILGSKETDTIPIKVTSENFKVVVDVDYTKLLTNVNNKYVKCHVVYTYNDINKIEEFSANVN